MSDKKNDLYFYQTYDFKGIELKPSKGRIDMAIAAGIRIGNENPVTQMDVLILIFCCLCDEGKLMYAQRDPAKFLGLVMDWRNKEVADEDLSFLTETAKSILEASVATKAEPMEDPNHLPDPGGN